jgi:hypothetical protein
MVKLNDIFSEMNASIRALLEKFWPDPPYRGKLAGKIGKKTKIDCQPPITNPMYIF